MTENFYTTENYNVDYSTFGGIIDSEDFNTTSPNKKRISNQIDAINLKAKNDVEKYKNMTLEELREARLISNTDGRPTSFMTDERWQKEFEIRKLFITPYSKTTTKLRGKDLKTSGMSGEETKDVRDGWQAYCTYIDDILHNIRSKQKDYCYCIFQIIDLLKFHYDDLRTKYCDGYWEVWLERKDK